MITNITLGTFRDAFINHGRGDSFTYQGFKALFEYFQQLEEDSGLMIELDPVAIDCEYTEYSDLEELQGDYPDIETIRDLQNQTSVIEFNHGSLIIVPF